MEDTSSGPLGNTELKGLQCYNENNVYIIGTHVIEGNWTQFTGDG